MPMVLHITPLLSFPALSAGVQILFPFMQFSFTVVFWTGILDGHYSTDLSCLAPTYTKAASPEVRPLTLEPLSQTYPVKRSSCMSHL